MMRFAVEKRNLMVLAKRGYPHAVAMLDRDYHARVYTNQEVAVFNELHQNPGQAL